MPTEYLYTSNHELPSTDILDRVTLDADTYATFVVEGGGVIWSIEGGARQTTAAVVVRTYDQSRHGEYDKKFKPHVMIRCALNAAGGNVVVLDMDSNLLYTFAGDCSVIPGYCVLRLTSTRTWEVA